MGMTVVPGDRYTGREAHVKDNVAIGDEWHLWISVWEDNEMVCTGSVPVADLEDATIEAAARGFMAGVFDSEPVANRSIEEENRA